MQPLTAFTSRVVPMPVENIDTDQIIPARFLKTTDMTGLGDNLFSDWRYDSDGRPRPDFVLNRPTAKGACVLLAGDNFGCGSSREHAPWALVGFGFKAVVSSSFADIFRNNALKNGLLPITVDAATLRQLFTVTAANPAATVTVDLANQELTLPNGAKAHFPIDPFAKTCLLQGVDELGYLLGRADAIAAYETTHPGAAATNAA